MDTMRRWLVSLTALGLLSAVVGCHHTAGVCDCSIGGDHCYGTYGAYGALATEENGIHTATREEREPPIIGQTAAPAGEAVLRAE
jgi:hypothetical protein